MPLTDTQGRSISYLRLSLTRACQMRCAYCRPNQLLDYDQEGDLSVDEIESLVRHLVENHGLHKVRLTGGDPSARPDLVQIIERIAGIDGIDDLAMTTNGLSLASCAKDYAAAGLGRVNVSLDSLNRDTFKQMTGVDGLDRVKRGIDAAIRAGLIPLRLNTVVMRHHNEDEVVDLVKFAASINAQIRFIEMMPMGPMADRWADHYVPEPEIRQKLQSTFVGWELLPQKHDSARRYLLTDPDGVQAVVGFITPMSCHFCAECNRLRIAADGTIYPCLMDRPAGTLRPALRPTHDPEHLDALIHEALSHKKSAHPLRGFATMTYIGG